MWSAHCVAAHLLLRYTCNAHILWCSYETKAAAQKVKVEPEIEGNNFVYYLAGALLFGGVIWGLKGFQAAEEYYAGYLLEQSLSVDNLFVFMLCFSFFKTPQELQGRVLSIGVWSAAGLRLVMILAGVQLVENFKPLLLVFAAILLYSSYGLLFGEDDEEEESDETSEFQIEESAE